VIYLFYATCIISGNNYRVSVNNSGLKVQSDRHTVHHGALKSGDGYKLRGSSLNRRRVKNNVAFFLPAHSCPRETAPNTSVFLEYTLNQLHHGRHKCNAHMSSY
jgi:hypothetical protein